MKKRLALVLSVLAVCLAAAGCSGKEAPQQTTAAPETTAVQTSEEQTTEETTAEETTEDASDEAPIPDGVYTAKFDTDSSMFHVNEACEGRGILTVENGKMTIHVSLASKNIVNLYPGLAEDAEEAEELLEPTEDEVTYSDGYTDTVYGFDIPVPVLDEEFDLALIGKKGKWYDHKVSVSDVKPSND